MKKLILASILAVTSFSSMAVTHFTIAGEGEIMLSESGQRAGLLNFNNKTSEYFTVAAPLQHENGCDIQVMTNDANNKDILTITMCENLKPMVKFGRYFDGKKVGGWLVDASRYMYFDK